MHHHVSHILQSLYYDLSNVLEHEVSKKKKKTMKVPPWFLEIEEK